MNESKQWQSTALLTLLSAALLASLAACTASSLSKVPAAPLQQPAGNLQLTDVSYDWHGLLVAPFGNSLKQIPLTLHEVLLFRDEARSGLGTDEPECYATDTAAPLFIGRKPQEYLLCFTQDHLSRVLASVRLPAANSAGLYAAACTLWLKNAAASAPSAAVCDGHDGAIHFSGRLEHEQESADDTLSIILDNALEWQ